MSTTGALIYELAIALRNARKGRGLSIAALAAQGGVSPRLVSEFERGRRSQVSLDTALRLLQLVSVPLSIGGLSAPAAEYERAARAARRRSTWVGEKTTLTGHSVPASPASHAARLMAVAQASRLAVNLRNAHSEQTVGEQPIKKRRTILRASQ